jgi:hypothetical protein
MCFVIVACLPACLPLFTRFCSRLLHADLEAGDRFDSASVRVNDSSFVRWDWRLSLSDDNVSVGIGD